jgi:hypothetical protein
MGSWSGYTLQILGLLLPNAFGTSIPVGFPLLSLPGRGTPHLPQTFGAVRELGFVARWPGSFTLDSEEDTGLKTFLPIFRFEIQNTPKAND